MFPQIIYLFCIDGLQHLFKVKQLLPQQGIHIPSSEVIPSLPSSPQNLPKRVCVKSCFWDSPTDNAKLSPSNEEVEHTKENSWAQLLLWEVCRLTDSSYEKKPALSKPYLLYKFCDRGWAANSVVELTLKLVSVHMESANCYGRGFEKPNTMKLHRLVRPQVQHRNSSYSWKGLVLEHPNCT